MVGRSVCSPGPNVVLLTTRGRHTGHQRTVFLQFFRQGDDLLLAAINAGLPGRNPDWYYNLKAAPRAQIEVKGRAFEVLAEELPLPEAAAAWSGIVQVSPDYARFRRFTDRTFPVVRLVGAATFAPDEGPPPPRLRAPGWVGWRGPALLALSLAGIPLTRLAMARLGKCGPVVVQAASFGLLGRSIQFALSGTPAQLRRIPRDLAYVEVVIDAVAVAVAWCDSTRRSRAGGE